METSFLLNDHTYIVLSLLGRGKGGYSFLVKRENTLFVLKKLHHEPCSYYTFDNKFKAETSSYERLKELGIRLPNLIEVDEVQEIIVKEYIEGELVSDLVLKKQNIDELILQVEEFAATCKRAGINLDYFPTNFVAKDNLIYYIDYEVNQYMDEWSFESWGKAYWSYTKEFKEYFHSLSKEILTPRLKLRKIRSDDYHKMYSNWCGNDNVTRYLPWLTHKNEEETKAYVSYLMDEYEKEGTYRWGIVYLENQELIGAIDVVSYLSDGTPAIGYVLSEPYWGKGIMSEAFKAVIDYLRSQGFKRLFITAQKENIGSNRVIQKQGFKFVETVETRQGENKPNIISKNNYILDL